MKPRMEDTLRSFYKAETRAGKVQVEHHPLRSRHAHLTILSTLVKKYNYEAERLNLPVRAIRHPQDDAIVLIRTDMEH